MTGRHPLLALSGSLPAFAALFLFHCFCFADDVAIVQPDKPTPVILVPESMEDQERYAVIDLQRYLQRMVGREFSVATQTAQEGPAIRIGNVAGNEDLQKAAEEQGRDGFILDVSDQGIRVVGGSKFGTAYGIYDLLERFGVRWLFPGDWGEVVPKTDELHLPAGRVADKPVFDIRQMHVSHYGNNIKDPTVAWMRRNRHNRSGFYGHNSGIVNPAKYGKTHPEWYAEVNGERRPFDEHFKLCHSNPEMVKQAIADVLEGIRDRVEHSRPFVHGVPHMTGDYGIFSISPTDGGGFCECKECLKQGSLSDRLQIFANTIADAVRKEFPKYSVAYYGAYSAHQDPPTIKAHPGVMVCATEWDCDFREPLSALSNRNFREKIEKFAEMCPDLTIYTYDGLYIWWGAGPLSFVNRHAADFQWYAEHGVRGFYAEANAGWGVWGYHFYMLGKLWWNPYADLNSLKDDFVRSAYGTAFEPMRRYYDILDAAVLFPSPSDIYAMRLCLEEAARMENTPEAQYRIDNLRVHYLASSFFDKYLTGELSTDDIAVMHRVLRSIDPLSNALARDSVFRSTFPDVFLGSSANYDEKKFDDEPLHPEELHDLLNSVVVENPGNKLSAWPAQEDIHLKPFSEKRAAFSPDMGMNLRDGSTILIYAERGERIVVSQTWSWKSPFETRFELQTPEQLVLAKGTATESGIVDAEAPLTGVYTLRIGPKSWPNIRVANRYAVLKASGPGERIKTVGGGVGNGWFYVPKGTKEFAIVTRPYEPMAIEIKAPSGPLPHIEQKVQSFREHRIVVPDGDDGKVWSLRLPGRNMEFYFEGIPPFLASDPNRLIVPVADAVTPEN